MSAFVMRDIRTGTGMTVENADPAKFIFERLTLSAGASLTIVEHGRRLVVRSDEELVLPLGRIHSAIWDGSAIDEADLAGCEIVERTGC